MKERSDVLMVAEIFSCCLKKSWSVNELSKKIYGNEFNAERLDKTRRRLLI